MPGALTSPVFSTFRDPAGSVQIRADGVYRQVRPPYDVEILSFLDTSLAVKLVQEGRLIASEVLVGDEDEEALVLRHPRIGFPSYPWEWAPAMWLSAAELTLELCRDLVQQGWILKDATPLNVLFRGARPVFVDVLSIERARLDRPTWQAYGQFVRTFLLPLLANAKLGWPLQAAIVARDGYAPDEIFGALSWRQRIRQPARSAITLPRMLSRIGDSSASKVTPSFIREPEITKRIILRNLSTLLRHTQAAVPRANKSVWTEYAQTANHYGAGDHSVKREFVAHALETGKPKRVLDVGCNVGVYSRLAADAGAEVVAVDTDLESVNRLAIEAAASGKNILPLCVDLARPTPAAGWEYQESQSFLDRCSRRFDMVMMLAVLHHLLVGSQVPLDRIAALCDDLTTRSLIVEWVPTTDPMFQQILRGRDALYENLTESAFRAAFSVHFRLTSERNLANGRTLFHFEKA
jgi:SAM-dependent methyltransferase